MQSLIYLVSIICLTVVAIGMLLIVRETASSVENFLQRDVSDHFGRDEMLSDLNGLSDYQKIGIIGGVALLIVALLWTLIMLFFVAIAFVVVGIYAGYSYDRLNRLHKKTNF